MKRSIFDGLRDLLYRLGIIALAVYFWYVEWKINMLEVENGSLRQDIRELFTMAEQHGWKRGAYSCDGWYAAGGGTR